MPGEFRFEGISFQYPENWELTEERNADGLPTVTVYSPGCAFWTLTIYPRSADPKKLAEQAVTALKEEYKDVEAEQVEETIENWHLTGYDFNFFYLDLINTAMVRSVRTDRATYLIFCQAEDREFEQLKDVFRAMLVSFVRSLKRLSYWDITW